MAILPKIFKETDENSKIIRQSVAASVGAGLIPIPVADLTALVGVQLLMIARIAKQYGVTYKEQVGRKIVYALLATAIPHGLAFGILGSAIKALPVVGSALGFASFGAFAGASTYALGKVLTRHFEKGGTLQDFNIKDKEEEIKDAMAEGEEVSKEVEADKKGK